MNSLDPKIRHIQAKLRSFGKRKKYYDEFQKKSTEELKDLKSKGQDFISKALAKMSQKNDPEFNQKFDDFVERFEALEDVLYLKLHS